MASTLPHCTKSSSSSSTTTATVVKTVAEETPGQLLSSSTDDDDHYHQQQQSQGNSSSSHYSHHREATGKSIVLSSMAAPTTTAAIGEAAPSNSSKYTTPKRPAGLTAVTPSTLNSSSSSDELMEDGTSSNSNHRERDDDEEKMEEKKEAVANHDHLRNAEVVVVGEGMAMEEKGDRNHHHQHQAATSTSSRDGEGDDAITTNNISLLANNDDVVVITVKPSIQLGPRVTPAPAPLNPTVKKEEEASTASYSSPVKPRNLDGALNTRENTNTTRISSCSNNGGCSSTAPAPFMQPSQDKCPSTPGNNEMAQQQQQQQQQFESKNALFPSSTSFLAAKISPLRSSSVRRSEEKKRKKVGGGGGTTSVAAATTMPSREKTPPPSDAILDDPVNLSPGMFLCTPKPIGNHGQEHREGGAGSLSLSSRPSSLVPGLTPTNFASDFGKGHRKEDSLNAMDASNVFAWLHSPTGQGLFSPNGGLNSLSAANTPRSMYGFSGPQAVGNKAGITPKGAPSSSSIPPSSSLGNNQGYYVELEAGFDAGVNTPKIPESQQNMICISPLSSKKMGKNRSIGGMEGVAPDTPMSINFSEVFASPRLPTPRLSRMGPPAGGGGLGGVVPIPRMENGVVSSSDGHQSSPVASALHVAERGINLDDDLNALLQLAETTTPGGRSTMAFMSPLLTTSLQRVTAAPPSSLQLPIITGSSITSFGKGGEVNSSLPQLAIRSSSSCGLSEGSASPIKASSLKKKVNKRKLPGVTTTLPGGHHGQQQPTPVGYSHPSMAPYQHLHVAPPRPNVNEITAANHRYYHHPAYISQGYVYSSTGHPAPQQHYAYPDSHLSTLSASASSTNDPSPVKSSHKTTPPVLSKQKSKHKSTPVVKKVVRKPSSSSETPPVAATTGKRVRKASSKTSGSGPAGVVKKVKITCPDHADKDRITAAIIAVNKVYGVGSEKERKLKEVTLRGVTQRPSRKWQAQVYYAGKSRYIGVFDSKEKASLAYEIAREVLKTDNDDSAPSNAEETERDVNLARKAAFAGVNELPGK